MAKKKIIDEKSAEEVFTFWNILMPHEKQFLRNNSSISVLKKNAIIHREGDIPTHMMVLAKGKLKVYKRGIGNRNQIIRMLKPGEHFSYRAIIAKDTYSTNVKAFEDSVM